MSAGTATLDVLAIGAHPDDVELGCGGTLAILAAAGYRTGILHLTRGEASTRGTVAERRAEAERAGAVLGAQEVLFLDCGDAELRHGRAEEDALIAVLRRLRPEILLGPTPHDRHPDHGRAHRLVADAAFYAGLAGRAGGREPGALAGFRPGAVYSYMQHDGFEPRFIVDVTTGWERKQAALAEYGSQLYQPGAAPSAAPLTKVSSTQFRLAMEGRARHFGGLIGADYGEPFTTHLPLPVRSAATLAALVVGGVR